MSKASEKKRASEAAKKNAPKGTANEKKDDALSDEELEGVSGGLGKTSPTLTTALNRATRTPGA